MSANDAQTERRIRQLKRLAFAEQSMRFSLEACHLALAQDSTKTIRFVLAAGIATLYASPFTEGNGLGRLEAEFSSFADERLRSTHRLVMLFRNNLYAHRDMSTKMSEGDGILVDLHRVLVEVNPLLEHRMHVSQIDWKNGVFQQVRRLCDFQQQRLLKKHAKLFGQVIRFGGKKRPGTYSLGDDYP